VSTDLVEEREFLLQSIRDLDAEFAAGDLDEADYRTLRDDYIARAAAVLRRLEAPASPAATSPAGATAPSPRGGAEVDGGDRPRRKVGGRGRAVAAAAVLALVSAGAGYAVATSSGERLATDEASGDIVEGSTDRITKAQLLVSEGRILEAVRVYDELLREDPENPVALAQRGWLLVQVGEPSLIDSGLASIDRAIALEPDFADAYFFRGMTLLRAKQEPGMAIEAFEQGLATNPPPEVRAGLEQGIELAREMGAEEPAPTTSAPSATP
jgi:tetratricopeptide (TPR) repeat protein